MFLGQYVHSIDDKGRLTLPSKFRPALEGGLVVTLGLDPCLLVFPRATWEAWAARIEALPMTNPDARLLARHFLANADDGQLDRQGRVLIPAYLRSQAQLDSDVVVAGLSSRIELWSPARWQEVRAITPEQVGKVAEHLAALGI